MARAVGGTASHILLWPLGGLAFIGHTAGRLADIVVAVAGPLTHIPMFVGWLLLNIAAIKGHPEANMGLWNVYVDAEGSYWTFMWKNICTEAMVMNLMMFLFNLLVPAYPLDGGRVLANALIMGKVDPNKAAKICVGITWLVSFAIVIYGVVCYFQKIPGVTFLILVPTWLSYQSYKLWRLAIKGEATKHPLFAQ